MLFIYGQIASIFMLAQVSQICKVSDNGVHYLLQSKHFRSIFNYFPCSISLLYIFFSDQITPIITANLKKVRLRYLLDQVWPIVNLFIIVF